MAEKPRVKAPKQRSTAAGRADDARRRRALIGGLVGLGALVGVAAVVALLAFGGGGGASAEAVRSSLEAAGCTFEVEEAGPAEHSVEDPSGTSDKWNTDPPTSGPHYPVAAIFGIYEEPLEQARLVHNLEHGGVFVQYGDDVPASTVDELRAFYDDHKTGTIMAPYPPLGDEFALGAWVAEGESGNGYLARCRTFDREAVSAFLSAFQFKGPERFDPANLRPGH